MKAIIRLAILAITLFSLSGCIAWRTGPYDYEFRVPIGDGSYKCCRTEKVKVVGNVSVIQKKSESGLPMANSSPLAKETVAGYKEVEVCNVCQEPSRYSFGGTVTWGYPGGYGGYSSSGPSPVVGGGAPTVAVPTPPTPGPTPAAPSKVGGAPAPAYKSK